MMPSSRREAIIVFYMATLAGPAASHRAPVVAQAMVALPAASATINIEKLEVRLLPCAQRGRRRLCRVGGSRSSSCIASTREIVMETKTTTQQGPTNVDTAAAVQRVFASLPERTFLAGETVFTEGLETG